MSERERLERIEPMSDARRQAAASKRSKSGTPASRMELDLPLAMRGGTGPARPDTNEPFVPSIAKDIRRRLVIDSAIAPAVVEQYRRLGATLHDIQMTRALKSVVITSALPQDGKTLTAVNLAFTLSDSFARRVLLIDSDLRRPSMQSLLGIPDGPGLREALERTGTDLPFIEISPRLSVLTAGRRSQSPLADLASDAMRALLDECEQRFDWVLLDAPPVGLLPDGQVLSRLTGAVLFVIRAGFTPYEVVAHAIRDLGREAILGTVLNSVDDSEIPTTNYYRDYL